MYVKFQNDLIFREEVAAEKLIGTDIILYRYCATYLFRRTNTHFRSNALIDFTLEIRHCRNMYARARSYDSLSRQLVARPIGIRFRHLGEYCTYFMYQSANNSARSVSQISFKKFFSLNISFS